MKTDLDLAAIEARAAAATTGPWHVRDEVEIDGPLDDDERHHEWLATITALDEDPTEYCSLFMQCCGLHSFAAPNAAFIAAARTDIPALCAAVRERDAEISALRHGDERVLNRERVELVNERNDLGRQLNDAKAEIARLRAHFQNCGDCLDCLRACDFETYAALASAPAPSSSEGK